MRKLAAALLIGAFCLVFFAACDNGGDGAITVWCSAMDEGVITRMVNDFKAVNPGVADIRVEICEDDLARETFESGPSAAADVICIPHDQLGALVSQGYLLEITGDAYTAAINENSAPSIYAGRSEAKQYGFPSSFETHMLFYDRSILSDAAVETLEGILASSIHEDGILFGMDFANAYFTANWFYTYGCMLFGESGEDKDFCDFDNEAGVAAMTYLIENRDHFGNLDGDAAAKLFQEGVLGAYIGGPWNAAAITGALKGSYGCAKLPAVEGMDMRSFAGYKLYCVNAETKNRKAAMDLAAWLTSPENQKMRFQARNLIPVARALADDIDVAVSTTAKAVMAQGANAVAMPSIPEMSNFWEPTGSFTLACYMGEITTDELPLRLRALTATILGKSPLDD